LRSKRRKGIDSVKYDLLQKTEIWISPVKLAGVDLCACAEAAARVLGLGSDEIMVTDVLVDTVTLDVLVPTVEAEKILGREKDLLEALAAVQGFHITTETHVHSEGILGFIALDEELGREILERSGSMISGIEERVQRRCLVFASGEEVLSGQIRDTNTPYLIQALKAEGYDAAQGPILEDRAQAIAGVFRRFAASGYGVFITTGGVGAEGKDQTLDALALVDAHASTPYILKFHKGQGRHEKAGVRVGVGMLEGTRIICLPGPHDEVELAWPVLREGLKGNWENDILAEALANILRGKFLDRSRKNHTP
jgi:molybdenum cofactor synthesis domain-containing protein